MSGQVSRGSAGKYQADERAGVARLWYNKELAPDEMLCGERKTEPGALQVRGTVVWLKNKKGIPSGHYIREDIRSWVVKIFFF